MEQLIRPLNISNFSTSKGGSYYSLRGHQFHFASDYPVGLGTKIYAANSGTLSTFQNSSCGNGITIIGNDNSPYITTYCHLDSYAPKILNKGSVNIKRGEYIGRVGSTGHSTGNHLHFKVRNKNSGLTINPERIDYDKYNYAGINWLGILFGAFTVISLSRAYAKESKRK